MWDSRPRLPNWAKPATSVPWPRRLDFGRSVEVLEVLGEAVAQIFRGPVVSKFVGRRIPWV